MEGLFELAEILPVPALFPPVGMQDDAAGLQIQFKMVQESGRFLINAHGKDAAQRNPKHQPQQREYQEGKGLYLVKIEQDRRKDGKYIDDD